MAAPYEAKKRKISNPPKLHFSLSQSPWKTYISSGWEGWLPLQDIVPVVTKITMELVTQTGFFRKFIKARCSCRRCCWRHWAPESLGRRGVLICSLLGLASRRHRRLWSGKCEGWRRRLRTSSASPGGVKENYCHLFWFKQVNAEIYPQLFPRMVLPTTLDWITLTASYATINWQQRRFDLDSTSKL